MGKLTIGKLYALKLTKEELWILMDNFGKTYWADKENALEAGISEKMAGLYQKALKDSPAGRKALQEQSHKHPPAASARGFPRKGTHLE